MQANGVITDVLRLVASTPMLFWARNRVRRKSRQPNLISDDDLRKLRRLLLEHKFRFRPATWKKIGRNLYARQHPWDRVVACAMSWCLEAAWTPVRHGSAYGWAGGRGTFDCMNVLAANLPKPGGPRDGFVVSIDAQRAFEHIRHDIVMKQLEIRVTDPSVLELLADFLESVHTDEGIGLGRGTVLAPVLADMAFSHVDHNWPEIGIQHLLQPCFRTPWSATTAPRREPEDWMSDRFGDLRSPLTPTDTLHTERSRDLPNRTTGETTSKQLASSTRSRYLL
jgi:retron-type reverse transcriptase